MNFVTEKDFFIITSIKVNFGIMHTVSPVRFQIWGLCQFVLVRVGGLIKKKVSTFKIS